MANMTDAEARAAVDAIKQDFDNLVVKITELWKRKAWVALGYSDWEAMCAKEFGKRQLPEPKRRQTHAQLRATGMSQRAIAAATGSSKRTVERDLMPTGSFEPVGPAPKIVTGTNGKQYSPTQPVSLEKAKKQAAAKAIRSRPNPPDPDEPTTMVDVTRGLMELDAFLAVVKDRIFEVGVPEVRADQFAWSLVKNLCGDVADAFQPFIPAELTARLRAVAAS
jgi:hypothetical protein